MRNEILNAKILKADLELVHGGILTLGVYFKLLIGQQWFSGIRLDGWEKTGEYLQKFLEICEVENLSDAIGSAVRVTREDGLIVDITHIIQDISLSEITK